MRSPPRLSPHIAAFLIATFAAPSLRADPASEALLREGIELRRNHRDAEALTAFERAYALDRSTRARVQVGFAEQATGQWPAAEANLAGALEAKDDAWVVKNRAAIVDALEEIRGHLSSLDVRSNAPAASLFVNGVDCGQLPRETPVRVPSGEATIVVRAPGYEPFEQQLTLVPRAVMRLTVPLHVLPPPEPEPAPLPSVSDTSRVPASPPAEKAISPLTVDRTSTSQRAIGWVVLATSGVLGAASVGAEVGATANASVWNDDTQCFYGPLSRAERCGAYQARADAFHTLAIAGAATAGGGVIAGVVLLLTAPKEHRTSATKLTCAPGGWAGIACGGTF